MFALYTPRANRQAGGSMHQPVKSCLRVGIDLVLHAFGQRQKPYKMKGVN